MPAGVDPSTAADAEQFLALLRQVRDQSGRSFRDIARLAQRHGDVLPASTLATMLGRTTLPRRDLVSALLRACDLPPDDVAAWLAEWSRLADQGGMLGPLRTNRRQQNEV